MKIYNYGNDYAQANEFSKEVKNAVNNVNTTVTNDESKPTEEVGYTKNEEEVQGAKKSKKKA